MIQKNIVKKKQKIIKKIGTPLLFLFVAITTTYYSRLIIPIGERTSSGTLIPGFPFTIFDMNSNGCKVNSLGCFNLDFLPLFFVIDIIFWIFLMYLIKIIYQRFKN